MILIIGSEEEQHSKHVFDNLVQRGYRTAYFDSRKYPDSIQISYYPNNNDGYFLIDNEKILFKDTQGIYWRWYYNINFEQVADDFTNQMVYRERASALHSIFESIKCNWVNPREAIEMHKIKAYQLNIMSKNNIRIPKTLITNNADELLKFYKENNKKIICKPVFGGAMTEIITEKDLTKDKLSTLKTSPVQLQEFIDGTDIRVYAMGEEIFSAEIRANTVDFRADSTAVIKPVDIPDNIKNDCKKILKLLKLKYSGIDIRKTKDNEYIFIEANPAPMFIGFEKATKYPITENLIKLLTDK